VNQGSNGNTKYEIITVEFRTSALSVDSCSQPSMLTTCHLPVLKPVSIPRPVS